MSRFSVSKMQPVNPLVSMLSETEYILFLKQIHRRHRSINSLSGLRIYKKWLHTQGFRDWDDWKPFVRIVINESSRWDSLYLSENDWDIDEEWYELGYWGYWDSAIHYLDVWIDFNEPWDDFEELEKRGYRTVRSRGNSLKREDPPKQPSSSEEEKPDQEGSRSSLGDSDSSEHEEANPNQEDSCPPKRKPEYSDSSEYEEAEPNQEDLSFHDGTPEASDSSEPYSEHEEELDFMTEEVKAQIGRMDERIAQILTSVQKTLEIGEDPAQLKMRQLEELEQKNLKLQADLEETQKRLKITNDEKSQLSKQVDKLERKDSDRDEILLLLEEKLNQLMHHQQASLEAALSELNQTLQDKVNLCEQVGTLQHEKLQVQERLNQTETKLAQQNEAFTAQLEALSQEKTQLVNHQQQLDQSDKEKARLLTLSEQANEERSKLLNERQKLQADINQGNEALQLLQARLSERSHLLEEANHQLCILTQNLSPALQTLNIQLSELIVAEDTLETQMLLAQLISQLTATQEQLQQVHPVALPLLESLRQEQVRLQTELSSTQNQLRQFDQEKTVIQSDLDRTTLQLRQVEQGLENSGREAAHLQVQLSDVTELLKQAQQQVQQEMGQVRQERSLYLETSRDREARTTQLLDQLTEKDNDLRQTRQQLDTIHQQHTQRQLELTNLESRLQHTQQELDVIKQQLAESEEIRQELQDRLSQSNKGNNGWSIFGKASGKG